MVVVMRRLMRGRLLAGFVAVAVLVPSVVLATHTFSDVPHGTYYTAAVGWAADNGVTSGTSATTFSPDDSVTRAQNVTFAHRYDQNVVQPALDGIDTAIDANTTAADTAQMTAEAADAPDRVVWVADDGTGDFLLLSQALASIVDASVSNPYVVRIAPGVYTETSPVALKTYVDVEGSGQGVTTITCECASGSYDASSATVSAGNIVAEIRHLTINNTGGDDISIGVNTEDVVDGSVSMMNVTATATGGTTNYGVRNNSSSPSMMNVTATATGGTYSIGVYNLSSSSPSMTDVTATASGGTTNYGVYNYSSSSPSMTNVTATASGGTYSYGVRNYSSSSPSMTNVTATATGGIYNRGVYNNLSSSPSMTDVTATATGGGFSNYGVYNNSSSPSMMNVTATGTGGTTSNYGVYNYNSSPSMTDVTATGTGGTYSYGVYNYSSSPSMTDVTATATGGTYSYGVRNYLSSSPSMMNVTATGTGGTTSNYGVYNYSSSSPSMMNVTATGTGGTYSYGVYNYSSSPSMMNVTATATGGVVINVGVYNGSMSTPTIRNSSITGTTNSILSELSAAFVAYTMLGGGAVVGGDFTCVDVINDSFALLDVLCVGPVGP
jgi:hypothetical protein